MRPNSLVSSLLLFVAASTAWPWPPSWQPLDAVKREVAPLLDRRQQSTTSKFDLSFSGTQGNTATTKKTTDNAKSTGKNTAGSSSAAPASSGTQSGKDTGKTTGKATATNSNGKQTTAKSKYETTKTFDDRLPAGGVSMITPNAIAGPQYYKIADYVTFAWNFTSLSITPSAIDILASCSTNSATYTLALNQTVTPGAGATQAITWDTGAYQATATQPLLMATYTLIIYDAQADVTTAPRAGYLGTWDSFTFGMYIPQPYTPIADYVCATCNSAQSSMERHTIGFILGMVGVTVLSFGWFGGVAGLW